MLKGKDGVVRYGTPVGSPAVRPRIGAVQNWNLDVQADRVTGWGMGDEWEEGFTTIKRYSGSVEFYLDPADPSADIKAGDRIPIDLYPGGQATGSAYFSGTVDVTGTPMSGAKDGIPMVTFNFAGSGELTEATV